MDSGDGPASLAVFLVGAIVVGLAIWVECRFGPPLWVHLLLWRPITIGLIRPLKAALAASQYQHRRWEIGL